MSKMLYSYLDYIAEHFFLVDNGSIPTVNLSDVVSMAADFAGTPSFFDCSPGCHTRSCVGAEHIHHPLAEAARGSGISKGIAVGMLPPVAAPSGLCLDDAYLAATDSGELVEEHLLLPPLMSYFCSPQALRSAARTRRRQLCGISGCLCVGFSGCAQHTGADREQCHRDELIGCSETDAAKGDGDNDLLIAQYLPLSVHRMPMMMNDWVLNAQLCASFSMLRCEVARGGAGGLIESYQDTDLDMLNVTGPGRTCGLGRQDDNFVSHIKGIRGGHGAPLAKGCGYMAFNNTQTVRSSCPDDEEEIDGDSSASDGADGNDAFLPQSYSAYLLKLYAILDSIEGSGNEGAGGELRHGQGFSMDGAQPAKFPGRFKEEGYLHLPGGQKTARSARLFPSPAAAASARTACPLYVYANYACLSLRYAATSLRNLSQRYQEGLDALCCMGDCLNGRLVFAEGAMPETAGAATEVFVGHPRTTTGGAVSSLGSASAASVGVVKALDDGESGVDLGDHPLTPLVEDLMELAPAKGSLLCAPQSISFVMRGDSMGLRLPKVSCTGSSISAEASSLLYSNAQASVPFGVAGRCDQPLSPLEASLPALHASSTLPQSGPSALVDRLNSLIRRLVQRGEVEVALHVIIVTASWRCGTPCERLVINFNHICSCLPSSRVSVATLAMEAWGFMHAMGAGAVDYVHVAKELLQLVLNYLRYGTTAAEFVTGLVGIRHLMAWRRKHYRATLEERLQELFAAVWQVLYRHQRPKMGVEEEKEEEEKGGDGCVRELAAAALQDLFIFALERKCWGLVRDIVASAVHHMERAALLCDLPHSSPSQREEEPGGGRAAISHSHALGKAAAAATCGTRALQSFLFHIPTAVGEEGGRGTVTRASAAMDGAALVVCERATGKGRRRLRAWGDGNPLVSSVRQLIWKGRARGGGAAMAATPLSFAQWRGIKRAVQRLLYSSRLAPGNAPRALPVLEAIGVSGQSHEAQSMRLTVREKAGGDDDSFLCGDSSRTTSLSLSLSSRPRPRLATPAHGTSTLPWRSTRRRRAGAGGVCAFVMPQFSQELVPVHVSTQPRSPFSPRPFYRRSSTVSSASAVCGLGEGTPEPGELLDARLSLPRTIAGNLRGFHLSDSMPWNWPFTTTASTLGGSPSVPFLEFKHVAAEDMEGRFLRRCAIEEAITAGTLVIGSFLCAWCMTGRGPQDSGRPHAPTFSEDRCASLNTREAASFAAMRQPPPQQVFSFPPLYSLPLSPKAEQEPASRCSRNALSSHPTAWNAVVHPAHPRQAATASRPQPSCGAPPAPHAAETAGVQEACKGVGLAAVPRSPPSHGVVGQGEGGSVMTAAKERQRSGAARRRKRSTPREEAQRRRSQGVEGDAFPGGSVPLEHFLPCHAVQTMLSWCVPAPAGLHFSFGVSAVDGDGRGGGGCCSACDAWPLSSQLYWERLLPLLVQHYHAVLTPAVLVSLVQRTVNRVVRRLKDEKQQAERAGGVLNTLSRRASATPVGLKPQRQPSPTAHRTSASSPYRAGQAGRRAHLRAAGNGCLAEVEHPRQRGPSPPPYPSCSIPVAARTRRTPTPGSTHRGPVDDFGGGIGKAMPFERENILLTSCLLLASIASLQPDVFECVFCCKLYPVLFHMLQYRSPSYNRAAYPALALLVYNFPSPRCAQRCVPFVERLAFEALRRPFSEELAVITTSVVSVFGAMQHAFQALLLRRIADVLVFPAAKGEDDLAWDGAAAPDGGCGGGEWSAGGPAHGVKCEAPRLPRFSNETKRQCFRILSGLRACWEGAASFFLRVCLPYLTDPDPRLRRACVRACVRLLLSDCQQAAPYQGRQHPATGRGAGAVTLAAVLPLEEGEVAVPPQFAAAVTRRGLMPVVRLVSSTVTTASSSALPVCGSDQGCAVCRAEERGAGDESAAELPCPAFPCALERRGWRSVVVCGGSFFGSGRGATGVGHVGITHINTLREVLHRLVDIAVSDPEEAIRHAALCSLRAPTFQVLYPYEAIINNLFMAVHDPHLPNRVEAVRVLRQLAPRNPPLIYPRLRQHFISIVSNFIVSLKFQGRRGQRKNPRPSGGSARRMGQRSCSREAPAGAASRSFDAAGGVNNNSNVDNECDSDGDGAVSGGFEADRSDRRELTLQAEQLAVLLELAGTLTMSTPLYLHKLLFILQHVLRSPYSNRDAVVSALRLLAYLSEDSSPEDWGVFEPFVPILAQRLAVWDEDRERLQGTLNTLQGILQSSQATSYYDYEDLSQLMHSLQALLHQSFAGDSGLSISVLKLMGTIRSIEPSHLNDFREIPANNLLERAQGGDGGELHLPTLSACLANYICLFYHQDGTQPHSLFEQICLPCSMLGQQANTPREALALKLLSSRFATFTTQLWPDTVLKVLLRAVNAFLNRATYLTAEGLCECVTTMANILIDTDVLHRLELHLPSFLQVCAALLTVSEHGERDSAAISSSPRQHRGRGRPAASRMSLLLRPLLFSALSRLVTSAGCRIAPMFPLLNNFLCRFWDASSHDAVLNGCNVLQALSAVVPDLLQEHSIWWLPQLLSVLSKLQNAAAVAASAESATSAAVTGVGGAGGLAAASTSGASYSNITGGAVGAFSCMNSIDGCIEHLDAATGVRSDGVSTATGLANTLQSPRFASKSSTASLTVLYMVLTTTIRCFLPIAPPIMMRMVCTGLAQCLLFSNSNAFTSSQSPPPPPLPTGHTTRTTAAVDAPLPSLSHLQQRSLPPPDDLMSREHEIFVAVVNRAICTTLIEYVARCETQAVFTVVIMSCLARLQTLADLHLTALANLSSKPSWSAVAAPQGLPPPLSNPAPAATCADPCGGEGEGRRDLANTADGSEPRRSILYAQNPSACLASVLHSSPQQRAKMESELCERRSVAAQGYRADVESWPLDSPLARVIFSSMDTSSCFRSAGASPPLPCGAVFSSCHVSRNFPFNEVRTSWESFAEMDLLGCVLFAAALCRLPAVSYAGAVSSYVLRRFGAADCGVLSFMRCSLSPLYRVRLQSASATTLNYLTSILKKPTQITREVRGASAGATAAEEGRTGIPTDNFLRGVQARKAVWFPTQGGLGSLTSPLPYPLATLIHSTQAHSGSPVRCLKLRAGQRLNMPVVESASPRTSSGPPPQSSTQPLRIALSSTQSVDCAWDLESLTERRTLAPHGASSFLYVAPSLSTATAGAVCLKSGSAPQGLMRPESGNGMADRHGEGWEDYILRASASSSDCITATMAALHSTTVTDCTLSQPRDSGIDYNREGTRGVNMACSSDRYSTPDYDPDHFRGLLSLTQAPIHLVGDGGGGNAVMHTARPIALGLSKASSLNMLGEGEAVRGAEGLNAAPDATAAAPSFSSSRVLPKSPSFTESSFGSPLSAKVPQITPLLAHFLAHQHLHPDEWQQWLELLCIRMVELSPEPSVKACEQLIKRHKFSIIYSDLLPVTFLSNLIYLTPTEVSAWMMALRDFYTHHTRVPLVVALELARVGHYIRLSSSSIFTTTVYRDMIDLYVSTEHIIDFAQRASNPTLMFFHAEASLLEGFSWKSVAPLRGAAQELSKGPYHRCFTADDLQQLRSWRGCRHRDAPSVAMVLQYLSLSGRRKRGNFLRRVQKSTDRFFPFYLELLGCTGDSLSCYRLALSSLYRRVNLPLRKDDDSTREEMHREYVAHILGAIRCCMRVMDFQAVILLWQQLKRWRRHVATWCWNDFHDAQAREGMPAGGDLATALDPSEASSSSAAGSHISFALSNTARDAAAVAFLVSQAAVALSRWDVFGDAMTEYRAVRGRGVWDVGDHVPTLAPGERTEVDHGGVAQGACDRDEDNALVLEVFCSAAFVVSHQYDRAKALLAAARQALKSRYAYWGITHTHIVLNLNSLIQHITDLEDGIHAVELSRKAAEAAPSRVVDQSRAEDCSPRGAFPTSKSGSFTFRNRGGCADCGDQPFSFYKEATRRRLLNIAGRALPVGCSVQHLFHTIAIRGALIPTYLQIDKIFVLCEHLWLQGLPMRAAQTLQYFMHRCLTVTRTDTCRCSTAMSAVAGGSGGGMRVDIRAKVQDFCEQVQLETYRYLLGSFREPRDLATLHVSISTALRRSLAASQVAVQTAFLGAGNSSSNNRDSAACAGVTSHDNAGLSADTPSGAPHASTIPDECHGRQWQRITTQELGSSLTAYQAELLLLDVTCSKIRRLVSTQRRHLQAPWSTLYAIEESVQSPMSPRVAQCVSPGFTTPRFRGKGISRFGEARDETPLPRWAQKTSSFEESSESLDRANDVDVTMLTEYYLVEHAVSTSHYIPSVWCDFSLLLFDVCTAIHREWQSTQDTETLQNFHQQSIKAIHALQKAAQLWRSGALAARSGIGVFSSTSWRRHRHTRSAMPAAHLTLKALFLALKCEESAPTAAVEAWPGATLTENAPRVFSSTSFFARQAKASQEAAAGGGTEAMGVAQERLEAQRGGGGGFDALDFGAASLVQWAAVVPFLVNTAALHKPLYCAVTNMCTRSQHALHQFVFQLIAAFEHDAQTVFPQRMDQFSPVRGETSATAGVSDKRGSAARMEGLQALPWLWRGSVPHDEQLFFHPTEGDVGSAGSGDGTVCGGAHHSQRTHPRECCAAALNPPFKTTPSESSSQPSLASHQVAQGSHLRLGGEGRSQARSYGCSPASLMLRELCGVNAYYREVVQQTLRLCLFIRQACERDATDTSVVELDLTGAGASACKLPAPQWLLPVGLGSEDDHPVQGGAEDSDDTEACGSDAGEGEEGEAPGMRSNPHFHLRAREGGGRGGDGISFTGTFPRGRTRGIRPSFAYKLDANPEGLRSVLRVRCHALHQSAPQYDREAVICLLLSSGIEVRFHYGRLQPLQGVGSDHAASSVGGGWGCPSQRKSSGLLRSMMPGMESGNADMAHHGSEEFDATAAPSTSADSCLPPSTSTALAPYTLMESAISCVIGHLPLTYLRRPLVLPIGMQCYLTQLPQRVTTMAALHDPAQHHYSRWLRRHSSSGGVSSNDTLLPSEAQLPCTLHVLHIQYEAYQRREDAIRVATQALRDTGDVKDDSADGSSLRQHRCADTQLCHDTSCRRFRNITAYEEALAVAFDSGDPQFLLRFLEHRLSSRPQSSSADGADRQHHYAYLISLPRPLEVMEALRDALAKVEATYKDSLKRITSQLEPGAVPLEFTEDGGAAEPASAGTGEGETRTTLAAGPGGMVDRRPCAFKVELLGAGKLRLDCIATTNAEVLVEVEARRRKRVRLAILRAESPRHASAIKDAFTADASDTAHWYAIRQSYAHELAEWSVVQYLLDTSQRECGSFFVDTASGHVATHGLGRFALQQLFPPGGPTHKRPPGAYSFQGCLHESSCPTPGVVTPSGARLLLAHPFPTADPCLFRFTRSLVKALPLESPYNTFRSQAARCMNAVYCFVRDLTGISAFGLDSIATFGWRQAQGSAPARDCNGGGGEVRNDSGKTAMGTVIHVPLHDLCLSSTETAGATLVNDEANTLAHDSGAKAPPLASASIEARSKLSDSAAESVATATTGHPRLLSRTADSGRSGDGSGSARELFISSQGAAVDMPSTPRAMSPAPEAFDMSPEHLMQLSNARVCRNRARLPQCFFSASLRAKLASVNMTLVCEAESERATRCHLLRGLRRQLRVDEAALERLRRGNFCTLHDDQSLLDGDPTRAVDSAALCASHETIGMTSGDDSCHRGEGGDGDCITAESFVTLLIQAATQEEMLLGTERVPHRWMRWAPHW